MAESNSDPTPAQSWRSHRRPTNQAAPRLPVQHGRERRREAPPPEVDDHDESHLVRGYD